MHQIYEHSKNDPIPEITRNDKLGIILLGAPGIGKSTFAKNYILNKNQNIKIFSTDDVSLVFTKDPNRYKEGTSELNVRRLKLFIEYGKSFIYDTTGTQKDNITNITNLSKEHNYTILFIHLMGTKDLSLKQNKKRERNVDIDFINLAYENQFKNMKYFSELKPDSYYIVYNLDGKYKFMKYDGKLYKRKVDKYVPLKENGIIKFNEQFDFDDDDFDWDEEEFKKPKIIKPPYGTKFKVGERVFHKKYGKGTILNIRSSWNIYVNFDKNLPDSIMNDREMNHATGYGCPYGHGWYVQKFDLYKIINESFDFDDNDWFIPFDCVDDIIIESFDFNDEDFDFEEEQPNEIKVGDIVRCKNKTYRRTFNENNDGIYTEGKLTSTWKYDHTVSMIDKDKQGVKIMKIIKFYPWYICDDWYVV